MAASRPPGAQAGAQTSPLAPPQNEANPRFDPKGTYVIGELHRGADPRYPEGVFKRTALDLPGRFFTKSGCRTVDAYFEKNPENRPTGISFYVYKRATDGTLKFLKSGSFMKSDTPSGGLSDGDGIQNPLAQIGSGMPGIGARAGAPIPGASLMAIQQIVSTTTDQTREIMQTHQQVVSNVMEQTQSMIANLLQQNQTILEKYQEVTDRYAHAVAAEEVAKANLQNQRDLIEFRKEVEQECATYYKDMEEAKPRGLADPEFLTAAIGALPHVINLIRDMVKPADASQPAPAAGAATSATPAPSQTASAQPAGVAPGPAVAQAPGPAAPGTSAVGPNGRMVVMPGPQQPAPKPGPRPAANGYQGPPGEF